MRWAGSEAWATEPDHPARVLSHADPSTGSRGRNLALVCGRFGTRATRQNLTSASPRFGLTPEDASRLIDGMVETVRRYWRPDVFSQGGTEADCAAIEPAFARADFEYEAGS